MGVLSVPQVFKIGGYLVYFWVNESEPLEPVHVQVELLLLSRGVGGQDVFHRWSYHKRELRFFAKTIVCERRLKEES